VSTSTPSKDSPNPQSRTLRLEEVKYRAGYGSNVRAWLRAQAACTAYDPEDKVLDISSSDEDEDQHDSEEEL
jgi:hypothetical protein